MPVGPRICLCKVSDSVLAPSQMALALAFHGIVTVVGMGMPALMVSAEWCWLKTGNAVLLELAKRWTKGMAIRFAVGAVSGTVADVELGCSGPHSWNTPGRRG